MDPFGIVKLYRHLRVVDAMDGIGYFNVGLVDREIRPLWAEDVAAHAIEILVERVTRIRLRRGIDERRGGGQQRVELRLEIEGRPAPGRVEVAPFHEPVELVTQVLERAP